MRIKLINPNTTQRMTDAMGRCAREVVLPGTEVIAVSPTEGRPNPLPERTSTALGAKSGASADPPLKRG